MCSRSNRRRLYFRYLFGIIQLITTVAQQQINILECSLSSHKLVIYSLIHVKNSVVKFRVVGGFKIK